MSCPADQYLMLGIQYICRYKLAELVPLHGETTFDAIASAAGLPVKDVTRFLRLTAGWHVFHETSKGAVVHTAASRQLLDNPMLKAWINNIAEEFWPSLARTVDATERWPGSEEPNESGYSLSHNTDENPFNVIKRDPARQQRFMDVQSFSHQHFTFNVEHLLNGYDFGSVRSLVDVGGAHGEVAIALARKYPHMKIVVQDQPEVIKGLEKRIPEELKNRIHGMEHDFFTPQPVNGADAYLLRWVFHNWSDKYCVKILQSLVPSLKKQAKIIINDICIPEPGQLGIAADCGLRQMDILMKAFNNARERDAETWEMLFTLADPRFNFLGIKLPQGARMAIIQAEWTGGEQ
ncbi:putative hydroxyindole O-methyltransferase [Daldinia caldariorum]|uniref:putative hydroxyindole O-methyltransferase n=1 Tax=Daldinia caldariorum TaxID=326644 RepID=UPI002008C2A9|nr:putative hydroxyindole O-methyltransferase [Daldinia caldariorum]KAI1471098.1 putative hydroxyindole O-methyltransferase [Daldinia caldariorum]